MVLVDGYTITRVIVVLLDLIVHMLVGYALVMVFTKINPVWGALGGLVPNLDLPFNLWPNVFPFVHRGILHTPLMLGLIVLVFGWLYKKPILAFSIGYLAELVLDVFESKDGIMFFYPFSDHHYALAIPDMIIWIPALLVTLSVFIYWYQHAHSFVLPRNSKVNG